MHSTLTDLHTPLFCCQQISTKFCGQNLLDTNNSSSYIPIVEKQYLFKIVRLFLTALLIIVMAPTGAFADECRSNRFQPTFVRHNSVAPRVWYVEQGGNFTLMGSPAEAQAACRARGVRQAISGQTCFQRNWGDFGCGCNITPSPNATCARFQTYLQSIGTGPGSADDQFCRQLYARGDAENRAGNTAREQQNLAGARGRYQQALLLFRQGDSDPRCSGFRTQFATALAIAQRNLQRVTGGAPPGPQPGGRNAFCDNYARNAVAQNQQNLARRCGYSGPRWQSNFNNHYNGCLRLSTNAANSEQRQRVTDLNRCTSRTSPGPQPGGRNAFCDSYARNAVAQNQQNLERRCGYSGPRWLSNFNTHYNWCVRTPTNTANSEQRQRVTDLNRCPRR